MDSTSIALFLGLEQQRSWSVLNTGPHGDHVNSVVEWAVDVGSRRFRWASRGPSKQRTFLDACFLADLRLADTQGTTDGPEKSCSSQVMSMMRWSQGLLLACFVQGDEMAQL